MNPVKVISFILALSGLLVACGPVSTPVPRTALVDLDATVQSAVAGTLATAPTNVPKVTPSAVLAGTVRAQQGNGQICVQAFVDTDFDGLRDQDFEPLLSGVAFILSNESDRLGTYTTDGNNEPYCFGNLPAGQYTIQAHPQARKGEPTTPGQWIIPLSNGAQYDVAYGMQVVVGIAPTATLSPSGCEIAKWNVIPTQIEIQPGPEGFKYVVVTYALENNSPYWGKLVMVSHRSYITTEGGFQYWNELPRLLYEGMVIPPGIVMPNVQVKYKVANTQNHFVAVLYPGRIAWVWCLLPGSENRNEFMNDPIVLNLEKDVRSVSYPTERPDSDFQSITESIQIPGKGTLKLLDLSRKAGSVVIRFKFTNTSAGYETSGRISAYMIGNDGIVHWDESGNAGVFKIPPAQSSEISFQFTTGSARSFKLALLLADARVDSAAGFSTKVDDPIGVFDLPDGY